MGIGVFLSGERAIKLDRPTVPAAYLAVLLALGVIFGGCGTYVDTTPPTSTLTDPPNYIFMNGPGETVTFRGTASDDTVGIKVEISFDDGSNWSEVINDPIHSRFDWSYAATTGELPFGGPVIWTRATDNDGNAEAPQLWSSPSVSTSSTPADLESFYASAGTVLYLSSGSGGAYGTSSSVGPVLANTKDLMVVGSGYGTALTADGFSAVDATPQTALATSSGSSVIFSVGSDLTLKDLRTTGGGRGVSLSAPGPVTLKVKDSVFEKQKGWGIYADDTNGTSGTVQVTVSGVMISASSGTGSNHGGVFLDDTVFDVSNSLVIGQPPASIFGAGIYAQSGSGTIDSSVFFENGYAIWGSNVSSVISSCIVDGNNLSQTNGIAFTGTLGTFPELRYNIIKNNSGSGVDILGKVGPIFLHNTITNNQNAGIFIDYDFSNINDLPVLGDCAAFNICSEGGRNSFFGNSPYDVIVSGTSSNFIPIFAQGNYWGSGISTFAAVDQVIQDGDINGPGTPPSNWGEDFPAQRAYLLFSPFDLSNPN